MTFYIIKYIILGGSLNYDFNGADQEGFGVYPTTCYAGYRSSTSRCFIDPIRNRPNLDVALSSLTHRCLIDSNNKCYGIEVGHGSRIRKSKKTTKIHAKTLFFSRVHISVQNLTP